MNIDQARSILAAHEAHDTALRNLRNAAAMAAVDSRSTEMLESAGTDYAVATAILDRAQREAVAAVPAAEDAGRSLSEVAAEDPPDAAA